MGTRYPGPGITLGAAATFGHLAMRHATGLVQGGSERAHSTSGIAGSGVPAGADEVRA
jgi:hypothetical protein